MLALYRRHKEARALLDYDDLVLGACRLLRGGGVPEWSCCSSSTAASTTS